MKLSEARPMSFFFNQILPNWQVLIDAYKKFIAQALFLHRALLHGRKS
jgi:hypothetical protein